MLKSCDAAGLATFDTFALAVLRSEGDQFHCAILFERSESKVLLHLAWNYRLLAGDIEPQYSWVETGLFSSNKKLLAVIADRVATAKPRIPYGLDRDVLALDPDTGNLVPGPDGKGMTCATFVLAVMESAGFNLLEEQEWPEGANEDWQSWIVGNLEKHNAPIEQVKAVARDIGSRRFSPTEVVGSATVSELEWPVPFERAQSLSEHIKATI